MSTPPDPKPDHEFVFPVSADGQTQPQPKKPPQPLEQDNILLDIAEEVVDPIIGRVGLGGCGCLWRLVTLPFRLVLWVVEEILD